MTATPVEERARCQGALEAALGEARTAVAMDVDAIDGLETSADAGALGRLRRGPEPSH